MNFQNNNLFGFDISKYQRIPADQFHPAKEINFNIMKSYGARFVIIKAGQGLTIDPGFTWNWPHAKEALIPRGSYYFEDKDVSPQEQARHYWELIKNDIGEGVHAMDFEVGSHTDLNSAYVFVNEFQQKSGFPNSKIAIYTGYPYWTNATKNVNDITWFAKYPLWLAWYPIDPLNYLEVKIPYPWNEVYMWQNATPPIGLSVGVWSRDIDHDLLNGNEDKLKYYFGETHNGEPMDITFTGSVKAGKNGVIVRQTAAGTDTGNRLNEFNPIQGVGTLVTAALNGISYQWMNIISPYTGWVATVNLNYTQVNPIPTPTITHKIEIYNDGKVAIDGGTPY